MKVLLVDLETAWRGGQNQAFLILKGLRERGHNAHLAAAKGSALGQRAQDAGFTVYYVSRRISGLAAAGRVHKLLASGGFDLVHANEAHAVSAVWLARMNRKVPYVISRRVGYPMGKSRFARVRYAASSRIIANSRWVAEQAIGSGAPREKVTVVYEGTVIPERLRNAQRCAARSHWGISGTQPLLGCVGVLLPDKGQEWLIPALVEVRKAFAGARLLLAGDGPCRPRLESLARKLGVADAVIFAGFVEKVESVYAALDVFLLPSLFEALNNSLLAAMAYEIPSVAFARGALGEIIEDGKSGLLVSGPNAEEISAAIVKFLRDAEFAGRLAREGRKRVEDRFSAEKMVDGMIEVYEQVAVRGMPDEGQPTESIS